MISLKKNPAITPAATAAVNKVKASVHFDPVSGKVMPGQAQASATSSKPATPSPAAYTPGQFNYDPGSDPVYQAALARAKTNAQGASGDAMAALNKRGILDSTATADRVAGIQQDAVAGVEADVMPQLMSQAYQRFRDSENTKYQMSRDAVNDKYQGDQFALQQGQLTGYYVPPEMKGLYDSVMAAKTEYAKATTPEARAAANQKAIEARKQIESMGGDASLVGSDVTFDQASGNRGRFGIQTSAEREAEWNRTRTDNRDKVADAQWDKTFDLNNTQTMAALTGHMPDGTPTTDEQQRQIQNLWTVAANTGKIPDQLADMYGIPRGTPTQAAYQFAQGLSVDWYNSDTSRMNAENAMDQTDLDYIKADNDMSQPSKPVSGAVAGNMLANSLQKTIGVDDNGKAVYGTITNWDTRERLFVDAWNSSGVAPGQDTIEMLTKAGYTTEEISKLRKGYPKAFNTGGTYSGSASPVKVPQNYQGIITGAQKKYGLSGSNLLAKIANAESSFNPNARNSRTGASGMFQFMPKTAQGYGIDPFDPEQAADAAGKMISGLLAKYDGDQAKALAGYNWGGGNVDKAVKQWGSNWLAHAPQETQKYIKKILG